MGDTKLPTITMDVTCRLDENGFANLYDDDGELVFKSAGRVFPACYDGLRGTLRLTPNGPDGYDVNVEITPK